MLAPHGGRFAPPPMEILDLPLTECGYFRDDYMCN